MLTPGDVHRGRADRLLEQRHRALQHAWARHTKQFVRGPPKFRTLPKKVSINLPNEDKIIPGCSQNHEQRCLNVVDRFRPLLSK